MKELIRMRSILIGDMIEKDKYVKAHARKYYMTDEIKKYREHKSADSTLTKMLGVFDIFSHSAEKNRSRRLKGLKNGDRYRKNSI